MALFICATPIGNLEDASFRLVRALTEADIILAEDTRRTAGLLAHFGIKNNLVAFHEHSAHKIPHVIGLLSAGKNIALVTDSGTPGISDPGGRLVEAAHSAKIPVTPVPGPSAVAAALSVSGMDANNFAFYGFPPKKGRANFFRRVMSSEVTSVLFESPYRIKKTLSDISAIDPERPIAICRELTKKFEETIRGTAEELSKSFSREKGEFVLIIQNKKE